MQDLYSVHALFLLRCFFAKIFGQNVYTYIHTYVAMVIKIKRKSLNVLSKDLIILIKNKKIKICTVSTHVAMVIKINEIRKSLNVIRTLTILIKK